MRYWTEKKVVIGISGGIAAYKSLDLIRRFREEGGQVSVVATAGALRFITRLTLEALTDGQVYDDLFHLNPGSGMEHIRLPQEADLIVLAPATADLLARMAGGRSDDLLTAMLLAREGPILAAPAMNPVMWHHPATRRNIRTLTEDGVHFVGPEQGTLACGVEGEGRLAPVEQILAAARGVLTPKLLAGKRILITAGPTREGWDPVRYLSNHSSGRMGWGVCRAALDAGARVTLVHGPVELSPPSGVEAIPVISAREMLGVVEEVWPGCDGGVLTAAVADFRPVEILEEKIKKGKKSNGITVEMVPNPDILATLVKQEAHRRQAEPGTLRKPLIGFAAETGNSLERGREKLARKGCDLLVVNDVLEEGSGFNTDTNRVTLLRPNAPEEPWPLLSKDLVGTRLIQALAELF
ncbi:MAG: bifunctional phosphopantothenoylcysteine decarboxylase/phosphopantothenate--cysteine ligase CoaBC [Magnetococcales bacterium]|nr:bifunctional phosphopantothenoylcysteine decarboxylase/phosphopantothenate--cysteine ligase CoaBC [Magnetococcales bacterium]